VNFQKALIRLIVPTAAQTEWIGRYSEHAASAIGRLEAIKAKVLAK
jgi:hypothetical protein